MERTENIRKNNKNLTISGVLFIVAGWMAALLSLFLSPFIFGVFGLVMGILATKTGSRAGLSVVIGNIILMGIGLVYNEVILNYARMLLSG